MLSDRLLFEAYNVPASRTILDTAKGYIFILLTAPVIYMVLKKYGRESENAENVLRKNEEKFRLLYEGAPLGCQSLDEEGLLIEVNQMWLDRLGYRRDEVIGHWFGDFLSQKSKGVFKENFLNFKLSGEVNGVEYEMLKKNGALVTVEFFGKIRYDGEGKFKQACCIFNDVTERKRFEGRFRHLQKMEYLGTLAGGVAHDFNNILTAIIGFGSILNRRMKPADPLRLYAEQILEASESAAQLTKDLLAFSRKQIISPKPVNVNEIIKQTENLLSKIIGEGIEFMIALSDKDLVITADSGQIVQVLMHLASNAKDAMPCGGTLTIGTELAELDHEYVSSHGYGEPGVYALISVTDTGEGMDEKTRERVFEPFFTTKEVGKGTGLGLAAVYGIIKQHNGYIDVHSAPGKGSMFNLFLPAIQIKGYKMEPLKNGGEPARGFETVLLAEDDGKVRKGMKYALEEYGCEVLEAKDGEDDRDSRRRLEF